jgi:hypothetical protein
LRKFSVQISEIHDVLPDAFPVAGLHQPDIVRVAADDKKECRPGNEQGEEVNHHENDDARCLFSSDKCEHTRSLRAAGAGDPDGSCATGWKNSGRSEASARKGSRRIS